MTRRGWFKTLFAAFVAPWLPRLKPAPSVLTLDEINATTLAYLRPTLMDNIFTSSPLMINLHGRRDGVNYYADDDIPNFSIPRGEGTRESAITQPFIYSTISSPSENGAN